MSYKVFIEEKAVDVVAATRGQQRKGLKEFIRSLGYNPFTEDDFPEIDNTGREVYTKLVGAYAVTYWSDHAVKEVKVLEIIKADE